jgi:hypothetical protein
MPSTSKKQHNLMAAVAKNPAFAKKVGIKQSVGEDFIAADKGKKFGVGGDVNYSYGGKNQANKQRTRGGSSFGYQKEVPDVNNNKYLAMREGGLPAAINKQKTHHTDGGVPNFANKAFKGLKGGGMVEKESKAEMRKEMAEDKKQDVAMIKKAFKQHDAQEHKGSKGTKLKLKTGGSVRGCGVAQKGLTKGRMV